MIEFTRFMLASKIADALTPYNDVDRPTLEAYQAGATFEVGTRAGWVAANTVGRPDKVAALMQEWWDRDAAVFDDLKARLNDNSDDEPSPVVAALSGVLDALEAGLEALAGVKVPGLDVLTPSPTAAQLREWPGIPGQLKPKVQPMGANDWKTYPRVELEVTEGSMNVELADDPLIWRVNEEVDHVELGLSVRKLTLTGTKAIAHFYIAVENFIWRLSVPFSLAAEHLHISNIQVSAALAPDSAPASGDDAVSVATVRGLVALKRHVSVDLTVDYEPSKAAKALRSAAQAVDALALPGDVVPSQAALERMIEEAIPNRRDHRGGEGARPPARHALGGDRSGGNGRLQTRPPRAAAGPQPDQAVAEAGAQPPVVLPRRRRIRPSWALVLGHRWTSDFEIHTPPTTNPFVPNKDAVREADASMVVAVVVDYVEDFIRRILLRLFTAEARPTDHQGPAHRSLVRNSDGRGHARVEHHGYAERWRWRWLRRRGVGEAGARRRLGAVAGPRQLGQAPRLGRVTPRVWRARGARRLQPTALQPLHPPRPRPVHGLRGQWDDDASRDGEVEGGASRRVPIAVRGRAGVRHGGRRAVGRGRRDQAVLGFPLAPSRPDDHRRIGGPRPRASSRRVLYAAGGARRSR
ncbi:MAG: hypothetical protein IPN01_25870 [Deltaproteobacteria bacterium]|nr:hypothetical protein [Deltaproteobacteria bacterium]